MLDQLRHRGQAGEDRGRPQTLPGHAGIGVLPGTAIQNIENRLKTNPEKKSALFEDKTSD